MDVFIGILSPRTTMGDLVNFFKSFASAARFQIFDRAFQDGSHVRYAVAAIASDKLARKVIHKLSGQPLKGDIVSLREYHHRSYNNERRALDWRDKPWPSAERRELERRRKAVTKVNSIDALLGLPLPGREAAIVPANRHDEVRKP